MKSAIVALSAIFSLASAAPVEARDDIHQSKPFYLIASSSNKTLDGTKFGACHEGAAIEGICVGLNSVFQFNTSSAQVVSPFGKTGILTWTLETADTQSSQGMSLYIDPSTNVALPLFEYSSTYSYVGFDKKNHMNIQSYLNDEVTPPTFNKPRGLYRWYVCESNYAGYVYSTLNWVYGSGKPENPTCQKVEVIRKFA